MHFTTCLCLWSCFPQIDSNTHTHIHPYSNPNNEPNKIMEMSYGRTCETFLLNQSLVARGVYIYIVCAISPCCIVGNRLFDICILFWHISPSAPICCSKDKGHRLAYLCKTYIVVDGPGRLHSGRWCGTKGT